MELSIQIKKYRTELHLSQEELAEKVYVTKVRALIFPRESLGEQYAAAVQMISTHMSAKKVNIRHVSAN